MSELEELEKILIESSVAVIFRPPNQTYEDGRYYAFRLHWKDDGHIVITDSEPIVSFQGGHEDRLFTIKTHIIPYLIQNGNGPYKSENK
jgi:hypothetical protein